MMLFPAVLMNFPNSKVCLIGEWSIECSVTGSSVNALPKVVGYYFIIIINELFNYRYSNPSAEPAFQGAVL